jgi:cellulose synthase/poly-beta-1,6-N-acetylglucosamine synthase-like glycosyltransferase
MRGTSLFRPGARTALAALASIVTGIDVYLLTLLASAARPRAESTPRRHRQADPFAMTVLVPAHDEERMIGSTVAALRRAVPPTGGVSVVVIADNCSDATAEVAARVGATVLQRDDPDRRGKGHALNWALDRLDELGPRADAIAIVDADCQPSAGLLTSLEARLRDGAGAVQAAYAVANPGASIQSSLRFAAFSLMNTVRPLGMERLGLSCGLRGTGMAFRRETLERFRFAPESLVEDTDLHLRLVDAGERVAFAPEASVRSPMPTSASVSRAQQSRWEGGRVALLRTWTAPLLTGGLRRRDPVRLHAWMELLVPPQSVLALAHVLLGVGALASRSRAARRIAALDAAMQAIFVVGGLRVVRAPATVYRALVAAPVLVVQKLGILGRLAVKGAPRTWERTEREAAS